MNHAMRSALELSVFVASTALIFRPLNRYVLLSRMPFVLEAVGFLLVLGLGDLGLAFSPLWRQLAGDSAVNLYVIVIGSMIVTGIPWAIVNLCLRRAVALNVAALVISIGWLVVLFLGLTGVFVWYL